MFSLLKQSVAEFLEDNCMRMAAALSYYTVFSLPPLIMMLIMILGISYTATGQGGEEQAKEQLQSQVKMYVGNAASEQVANIIANAGLQSGWMQWLLGIAGVLVGATGVVIALQDTLNEAWEVQPDPDAGGVKNFLLKRVFSLGMILGVGFVLLVSTLLTTWVEKMFGSAGNIVASLVTFLIIAGLFSAMFKYLPDAHVRWKDVLFGGVLTALLFTVGRYILSLYLSKGRFESQFGAAAAMAVLLAWVYYSSIIFLFGAEFTQAWAKSRGHGITPEAGAVLVERQVVKKGQG